MGITVNWNEHPYLVTGHKCVGSTQVCVASHDKFVIVIPREVSHADGTNTPSDDWLHAFIQRLGIWT